MTDRQKAELDELRNDVERFRNITQTGDIVKRLSVLSAPGNPHLESCIKDAIKEIEELRDALHRDTYIPLEHRIEILENKVGQLLPTLR